MFTVNNIRVDTLDEAVKALFDQTMIDLGFTAVSGLTDGQKRMVVIGVVDLGGLHFRNCVHDLAKLLNVSRTTIYKVINGKTTPSYRGNRITRV